MVLCAGLRYLQNTFLSAFMFGTGLLIFSVVSDKLFACVNVVLSYEMCFIIAWPHDLCGAATRLDAVSIFANFDMAC